MPENAVLVGIDYQHDFCDPQGSLFVPGAEKDASRFAELIRDKGSKFNDIHMTLDSHHVMDIAHPDMWLDGATRKKHPEPFTLISADDVMKQVWVPFHPSLQKKVESYVKALADNGRYPLVIWPPHCIIGTWGNNIVPEIRAALREWERDQGAWVNFVTKGSNPWTEHYSAVQADVPDPNDPNTQLNTRFIEALAKHDVVYFAGEALSHCVANTVRDVASQFGDENVKKIKLIINTTSSVPNFEKAADDFIKEMTDKGMELVDHTDVFKAT